ncbi:MAG: histidine phosphatase family protein [Planctomycetes bacterium]|nr:histidine phosphatase family protein [Planctomycetota bacterium]
MPTFWFVRHGESVAQVSDWPGADCDVPLSDAGRAQARALSLQLPGLPIGRALCSTFLRAVETAQIALEHTRHAAIPVDDLRERFAGDWVTLFRQDAEKRKHLAHWEFTPPRGESVRDATRRGLTALAKLESRDDTIVFAHGRLIAGILTVLDAKDPRSLEIHAVPNCQLIERDVSPGTWARLLKELS